MYRNYRVTVLRDAVLGSEFVDTIEDQFMTKWAVRYYEALVGSTSTTEDFIVACRAAQASMGGLASQVSTGQRPTAPVAPADVT